MYRTHATVALLFAVLFTGSRAFGQDMVGILNEDYVCTIDGQVFRGTLCYPAGRDGMVAIPFGGPDKIYFIVEDPDQVFIYDIRDAKKHASDHAKLFGQAGWDLKADLKAVRLDQHRWQVSGKLPKGHWQLVYGSVVKGGIYRRPPGEDREVTAGGWVLNTSGVTFPQNIQKPDPATKDCRFKGGMDRIIAEYTKRIAKNPNDPKLYLKRGNAYGLMRQFEKAYTDLKQGGGTLVVEVFGPKENKGPLTLSADVPLMTGNRKVGAVPSGTELTVKRVNGNWLGIDEDVETEQEGGSPRRLRGWIHKKYANHVK